jgi:hypothetical protein
MALVTIADHVFSQPFDAEKPPVLRWAGTMHDRARYADANNTGAAAFKDWSLSEEALPASHPGRETVWEHFTGTNLIMAQHGSLKSL